MANRTWTYEEITATTTSRILKLMFESDAQKAKGNTCAAEIYKHFAIGQLQGWYWITGESKDNRDHEKMASIIGVKLHGREVPHG